MNLPHKSQPILEAAKNGNAKCIDVLFEGGANVDVECTTMKDLIRLAVVDDQNICAEVLSKQELNWMLKYPQLRLLCSVLLQTVRSLFNCVG